MIFLHVVNPNNRKKSNWYELFQKKHKLPYAGVQTNNNLGLGL